MSDKIFKVPELVGSIAVNLQYEDFLNFLDVLKIKDVDRNENWRLKTAHDFKTTTLPSMFTNWKDYYDHLNKYTLANIYNIKHFRLGGVNKTKIEKILIDAIDYQINRNGTIKINKDFELQMNGYPFDSISNAIIKSISDGFVDLSPYFKIYPYDSHDNTEIYPYDSQNGADIHTKSIKIRYLYDEYKFIKFTYYSHRQILISILQNGMAMILSFAPFKTNIDVKYGVVNFDKNININLNRYQGDPGITMNMKIIKFNSRIYKMYINTIIFDDHMICKLVMSDENLSEKVNVFIPVTKFEGDLTFSPTGEVCFYKSTPDIIYIIDTHGKLRKFKLDTKHNISHIIIDNTYIDGHLDSIIYIQENENIVIYENNNKYITKGILVDNFRGDYYTSRKIGTVYIPEKYIDNEGKVKLSINDIESKVYVDELPDAFYQPVDGKNYMYANSRLSKINWNNATNFDGYILERKYY